MDSFTQTDVYARIGNETSRRKACPPRLPSGFCLESCSHRIKDMPSLWSGEESFAGERGKMEEGIWISVRLDRLISVTVRISEKKRKKPKTSEFWLFFALAEKTSRHPFARMCPNQACNYNLEHAVKCNSSRQFKWKQRTLFPAHCVAQLQSKSFWFPVFCFLVFWAPSLTFWRSKTKLEQLTHTRVSPFLCKNLRGWLTVAVLLQIPGTREWMRGGLEG